MSYVDEYGNVMLTAEDGGVAFFQLAALKGAVSLECKGLKRRGRSATAIAKERYGLTGNRQSILQQLTTMVDAAIATRKEQT